MPRRVPKYDYTAVRQEYITTDVSLNELARRLGISNSTIAERARNEEWAVEREAYRRTVTKVTTDKVADRISSERAAIENERVNVLRVTLRQYAKQIMEGSITVSPKDAIEAVKALKEFSTEDAGGTSDTIIVPAGGGAPSEWLRRVLEIARERGSSTGSVEGDRGASSPGTRVH